MTATGVVVVVQARTGSTRLPGKVLAELAGRPMLRFQLDRLQAVECDRLVVATTDLDRDDPVAELALAAGAEVVRGSEADVLHRFGAVLERFDPHVVVRLTGDNPLTDPGVVGDVVALRQSTGVAYASNVFPRTFPKGLDVEVATAAALAVALAEAVDPYEREHVMPFLYRNPDRFTTANLASDLDLGGLRWTVDEPQDLEHVRQLVRLVDDPVHAPWTVILAAARAAGVVS